MSLLRNKGSDALILSGRELVFYRPETGLSRQIQQGHKFRLHLPPSEVEYLVLPAARLPAKKAELSAYFKWTVKQELFMSDPAVCWKQLSESNILLIACEKKTILFWSEYSAKYGVLLALDGMLTPLLCRAMESAGRILLIFAHEQIMLAGISDHAPVFVRKIQAETGERLSQELLATLSYYNFDPDRKLVYTAGPAMDGAMDLKNESVLKEIFHA